MAQRLITIDDMDGAEGAEPITFSVQGVHFVIDLTEPNLKLLYEALVPFIQKGRKRLTGSARMPEVLRAMVGDVAIIPAASPSKKDDRGPDVGKTHTKEDLESVRAFAKKFGIVIGRGRIPQDVWDCWRSARSGGDPDFSLLHQSRHPARNSSTS